MIFFWMGGGERYSLGTLQRGTWSRPPTVFAAVFSGATKETIFQPWLLAAARP